MPHLCMMVASTWDFPCMASYVQGNLQYHEMPGRCLSLP